MKQKIYTSNQYLIVYKELPSLKTTEIKVLFNVYCLVEDDEFLNLNFLLTKKYKLTFSNDLKLKTNNLFKEFKNIINILELSIKK
ncbi:MAG: hypothetical protein R3Y60_02010 [bacterium]